MPKDYYNILGVNKNASADEIKTAFRKKAHEHHPDKGGSAEKFKEYNEAYQVLGNPEKRKQYDQFGSAFQHGQAGGGFNGFSGFEGFSQGGMNGMNFDFGDLGEMFGGLGDIFGFGGGRQTRRRPARGRDLEVGVELDFLTAAFGTEKEINFPKLNVCSHCDGQGAEPGAKIETCPVCKGSGYVTRIQRTILGNVQAQSVCSDCQGEGQIPGQKCSRCHGSGQIKENFKIKVRIPAGINNEESIRLSGQGEAGPKGAPAGDLYLKIRVLSHKKFQRDNYDIRTEEPIGFSQAALGTKIEIETIHGALTLKIPEGTQSGTVFKLKDKGVPRLHGRGQGDHYVKVIIKTPTSLTKKQKQLLQDSGL